MPTGVYHRTDVMKRKISEGMKKYLLDPVARKHRGDAQRGVPRPDWVRKKISNSHKGLKMSKEHRLNMIKAKKAYYSTEDGYKKLAEARKHNKGYVRTEKHRIIARENSQKYLREHPEIKAKIHSDMAKDKYSKTMKELFKDKEYKEDRLRKMRKGVSQHIKPNKVETKLLKLLNIACPYEYKFTGNYDVIIGGKCPDFTNINGKKKLIEVYGDYWHSEKKIGRTKEKEELYRKEHYLKYGYDCLILWEREINSLSNKELIQRILEYNNKEVKHATS